jgi:hypothetical protein
MRLTNTANMANMATDVLTGHHLQGFPSARTAAPVRPTAPAVRAEPHHPMMRIGVWAGYRPALRHDRAFLPNDHGTGPAAKDCPKRPKSLTFPNRPTDCNPCSAGHKDASEALSDGPHHHPGPQRI